MKWRTIGSIALALGILSGCASNKTSTAIPPTTSVNAEAAQLAEQYLAKRPNAGIVVGIIKDGKQWVQGYGKVNGDASRVPDGNTIYEIGSITKVFTGLALADAVEQGSLNLDDTIKSVLPANVQAANGVNDVTFKQLVTHTSGFPRLSNDLFTNADMNDPYKHYDRDMLYASLSDVDLEPIDGLSAYSNYGMALLGQLLADQARQPYETLVVERINKPLGMNDTVFTLSSDQEQRLNRGYNAATNEQTPNWNLNSFAPAGGLRSSANDMLIFMQAQLAETTPAIKRSHTVLFEGSPNNVAYAWQIAKSKEGQEMYWHNGGTGGYVSFLGFDRTGKFGVIVLSNYGDALTGDDSIDRLGITLMRSLQTTTLQP